MTREATLQDLLTLRQVEEAAGALFRELGMEAVANDDPPSLTELSAFQADRRAWVCTDKQDLPVAYIFRRGDRQRGTR